MVMAKPNATCEIASSVSTMNVKLANPSMVMSMITHMAAKSM